jgi:hypothetical protein
MVSKSLTKRIYRHRDSFGDHHKVAFVCPRCAAPAIVTAEMRHSPTRLLRCSRCANSWVYRSNPFDRRIDDGREWAELSVAGACRAGCERIVEHEHSPSARRQPVSAGTISSRKLFRSWFGAVAAAVVCFFVVALALRSTAIGAPPTNQAPIVTETR